MGMVLQSVETRQAITHTIQTSFKPSFPNSKFQILKIRIVVNGFKKCDRFFKINGIKDQENLRLASLHLKGNVLEWFQGYGTSNMEINWTQFSIDFVSRFDPSVYDNPIGQITKLKQVFMVRVYQEQFEALMARTSELP